ncbi:MAG TPA: response regulator [Blastocatellia bacterium]|nr:response regulator [Blastocatellia bacterium]
MKAKASTSKARRRILYVESHDDSREMLAEMLSYAGYEVATTTNVADGLGLARLEGFDLYILGSRFSDGTGIDLCRQIRGFDPGTAIIFFSSAAYASDVKAGMAAGAQHYLVKPAGIYAIEQTIAGVFAEAPEAWAYSL